MNSMVLLEAGQNIHFRIAKTASTHSGKGDNSIYDSCVRLPFDPNGPVPLVKMMAGWMGSGPIPFLSALFQ